MDQNQTKPPTEEPQEGLQDQPEVTSETDPKVLAEPNSNKKLYQAFAAIVGLLILGVVLALLIKTYATDSDDSPTNITNYEECAAAGYPILEIYPEQCAVPGGETFTRQLTKEEQQNLNEKTDDLFEN